jgi:hypothetical protein
MIEATSTKTAAKTPILSIGDDTFGPWNEHFMERGNYDWGDAGLQLATGRDHTFTWPRKPTPLDPFVTAAGIEVMALKRYPTIEPTADQSADPNFNLNHLPLAKDAEVNLRADIVSWEKEREAFKKDDVSLLLALYNSVSTDSMTVAKASPGHAICMALPVGARSLAFYRILVATHSTGDARTKLFRCSQLMLTKQGDLSHEKFRALVDTRFQAVDNTFNIIGEPLYWNKYEIKTAIYLFGLREADYAMPLEALLQAHPTGRMSDSTKIMDNMQLWVNNHRTTLSMDPVSTQLALAAVVPKDAKPASSDKRAGNQKKPCHVCVSFGRTESAKHHTAENCFVNKNSPKFSKSVYDKMMESKHKILDSASVASTVSSNSSASERKVGGNDRHLRALLALHEEADTHEMKLSALAAVSDYAAMMAHEAEVAADKAAASK